MNADHPGFGETRNGQFDVGGHPMVGDRPRNSSALPPVTAAWREGDPLGSRRIVDLADPLILELGGALPRLQVAYESWGRLNARRDNAVLVLHALTGDSHASGPAGPTHPTPGWWDGLIGPGRALDTDRYFVVCPNVLGGCQGTTGPASRAPDGRPWGSRFPIITVRDQVATEAALADELGIDRWASVIGGSMGGMRALEWAVTYPDRVASVAVFAVGAYASAEQIAFCSGQIHAIKADPKWRGGDYYDAPDGDGPHVGLGVARRLAHVTYRSEPELAVRFGRDAQAHEDPLRCGRFAVQSYLDHHADKLVGRFDANTYIVLSAAMNSHDVGRGRGGVTAALRRYHGPAIVGGVDSDRLYPVYQQQQIADGLPGTVAGLRVISSPYGHDAFLIATDQISPMVREFLEAHASSTV